MEEHLNQLNFKHAIPTGIATTNFNMQINLIFVSKEMCLYTSGVYGTYLSDHKPIFISLNSESKISILKKMNVYKSS